LGGCAQIPRVSHKREMQSARSLFCLLALSLAVSLAIPIGIASEQSTTSAHLTSTAAATTVSTDVSLTSRDTSTSASTATTSDSTTTSYHTSTQSEGSTILASTSEQMTTTPATSRTPRQYIGFKAVVKAHSNVTVPILGNVELVRLFGDSVTIINSASDSDVTVSFNAVATPDDTVHNQYWGHGENATSGVTLFRALAGLYLKPSVILQPEVPVTIAFNNSRISNETTDLAIFALDAAAKKTAWGEISCVRVYDISAFQFKSPATVGYFGIVDRLKTANVGQGSTLTPGGSSAFNYTNSFVPVNYDATAKVYGGQQYRFGDLQITSSSFGTGATAGVVVVSLMTTSVPRPSDASALSDMWKIRCLRPCNNMVLQYASSTLVAGASWYRAPINDTSKWVATKSTGSFDRVGVVYTTIDVSDDYYYWTLAKPSASPSTTGGTRSEGSVMTLCLSLLVLAAILV